MAEARDLYKRFFARTREVLDTLPALKNRKFAVLGVHWPSKKFAEQTLIPGGAAGLHSQVDASQIKAQLQALKGFLTIRKQIRSFKKRRHSSIAWKTKPRRAKNLSIAARFAARAGQSGQGKPGGIFQDRRR
ncbi:MAG: hypothetical protein ABIR56_05795 [Polaromonas sp.]